MTNTPVTAEEPLSAVALKLHDRAVSLGYAEDAYKKTFDEFMESLTELESDAFWEVLDDFRKQIIRYRFSFSRTNGTEMAASEVMRAAWCGETNYTLNTALRFIKSYSAQAKRMANMVPSEFGGGDSYSDVVDGLPLLGRNYKDHMKDRYGSISEFVAAVRTTMKGEMEDHRHLNAMCRYIAHAQENYNRIALMDAGRKYAAVALRTSSCPISDKQYLRIELPRESLAELLDLTRGPVTVQAKVGDDGVALVILNENGEVIDSARRSYQDAGHGTEVKPEA